jgi:hypothetical protein
MRDEVGQFPTWKNRKNRKYEGRMTPKLPIFPIFRGLRPSAPLIPRRQYAQGVVDLPRLHLRVPHGVGQVALGEGLSPINPPPATPGIVRCAVDPHFRERSDRMLYQQVLQDLGCRVSRAPFCDGLDHGGHHHGLDGIDGQRPQALVYIAFDGVRWRRREPILQPLPESDFPIRRVRSRDVDLLVGRQRAILASRPAVFEPSALSCAVPIPRRTTSGNTARGNRRRLRVAWAGP